MADGFVLSAPPGATPTPTTARSSTTPSRAVLDEVQRRRSALAHESQTHQRALLHGRWMTDADALRHRETRRREQLQRRAPQQAAAMRMYAPMEQRNTGIELEEHEVMDRVTQSDLASAVDSQTRRKQLSLTLDTLGPYLVDFSRNGTHVLLAGRRGHVANLRWTALSTTTTTSSSSSTTAPTALEGEVQLKERIHDAIFVVDHSMMAMAQRKYVYLYGKDGSEMHILAHMAHMNRLAFLPRHLLLAAASSVYSVMQYVDVSTGQALGGKAPAVMQNPATALVSNPGNGVVVSGDVRGVVKFWSPSVVDPLIQLKAHAGVVQEVRFHPNGRYFVTLGAADHTLKVWDCRTLRSLDEYAMRYMCQSVDVSSSGLVALGGGCHVQIWKDMFTAAATAPSGPCMKFPLGYAHAAERVRFCPFEDVLGVGHGRGFTTLLVPGSGEANPDVYHANPHETERQRGERVVGQLLDKLPPDTISMDVQVAGVNEARLAAYRANLQLNRKAKAIREKKERRADRAAVSSIPRTGLLVGTNQSRPDLAGQDDDDELDEELGYKEQPVTRTLKTRQERAKEAKSRKWDKKDSADKVRSKQTMRQSRMVQKNRAQSAHERRHGAYDADDLGLEEMAALAREREAQETRKKRRRVERAAAEDDIRLGMRDGAPVPLSRGRSKSSADGRERTQKEEEGVAQNAALRRWMR